jgi:hypothetical protein
MDNPSDTGTRGGYTALQRMERRSPKSLDLRESAVNVIPRFSLAHTHNTVKAGLFSAVVTTFIVESYKLLLPDPNAAMTALLFHIASGLNNISPFPPSVSPESIPSSPTFFHVKGHRYGTGNLVPRYCA